MHQFPGDLTISDVLNDPLIRSVLKADGVTVTEFKTLLQTAADALRHASPKTVNRPGAAADAMSGKNALPAGKHPLAKFHDGVTASAACY